MTGTKCVVSDSRPTLPCSKAAVTRRKKYRALVLVLASDSNALFKMFKSVWEQMMFTEPDVGIFFVYGGKEVAANPTMGPCVSTYPRELPSPAP